MNNQRKTATSKRAPANAGGTSSSKSKPILPPDQLRRLNGYKRIVAGTIFLLLPSMELYRRLYMNGERKMQQGIFNPDDGSIREFSPEEKVEVFQNSWLTKIFGEK